MISVRPLKGNKGSHGGLEEIAMKQFVWLPNILFSEIKVILHGNEIAILSRCRNKSGRQRILVKMCIIFPERNIQVEIDILGFQAKKMRLFSFWVDEQDEQSSLWQRRALARWGRHLTQRPWTRLLSDRTRHYITHVVIHLHLFPTIERSSWHHVSPGHLIDASNINLRRAKEKLYNEPKARKSKCKLFLTKNGDRFCGHYHHQHQL